MAERYADIIERLEKATGPDRELDAVIKLAVAGHMIADGAEVTNVIAVVGGHLNDEPPAFTASIDAAIALVERMLRPDHPGMTVNLDGVYSGDHSYWYAEITWPSSERRGLAHTPASALLRALFRALQQEAEK